jgi:phosphoglycolate phosphatase
MTQKLTVLFDLDGTLIDTAPDLMNAHNHVMKKFGYETRSTDEIRNLVGKGAASMIGRSMWNQAKNELKKIDDEEIKSLMVKEFIDYYGKNIANESKLIRGVSKFLVWCKSNNISMAVCTNKTEHLAVDLLKRIEIYDYFEYVAGYNTFEYCKPDPRHLTSVVEILQGDVKKTIMVGDSETDAESAKAANMPFILVEGGYTDKNPDEIYHNYLVKDFINLEKLVLPYIN